MTNLITNKNLTIVNFAIVSFFILIFMLNYFKVEFALLDVYREIMTIPFLIAQIVFLIISINYILKNQKNSLTILSVVALAISSFITIGSFF